MEDENYNGITKCPYCKTVKEMGTNSREINNHILDEHIKLERSDEIGY